MSYLWYRHPAKRWEEALPVGNGRLGGMVYSGPIHDRIQINEDTIWSGGPEMTPNAHSMSELTEIRRKLRQGQYDQACGAVSDMMLGACCQGYLSYGTLFVDVDYPGEVTDYRRQLDLDSAVVSTSCRIGNNRIEKEVFSSLTDDLLVIHIKAEQPCTLHVYQASDLGCAMELEERMVTLEGKCPTRVSTSEQTVEYDPQKETIRFCSRIRMITEGRPYGGTGGLWVEGTREATVLFSLKTSFAGFDKLPVSQGREYRKASAEAIRRAEAFSYAQLRERHVQEYQKYYHRVSLQIDGADYSHLPTDERIKNAANGTVDNELVTQLFDFARYLTVSGSMKGTQPMNLQGIWCQRLVAPWYSDYTLNINTEMNYWPTETVALPECHMPLLEMLRDLAKKGNTFGLPGWAVWHNTDLWRFNHESTKEPMWGFWIMGGAWCVRHIWEHYLHTRDLDFLREYYPVMTGAAAFMEGWMLEDEQGCLTTSPSTSPENRFCWNGVLTSTCQGSAMDLSILYDLFDKTSQAGAVLGENVSEYLRIRDKIRPVSVGADGRILEWGLELTEGMEDEPGHRHISHLYGLYPSDLWREGKYVEAAKKSLLHRLENGGGHTGWSNAWIACIWARLRSGEDVGKYIRNMFAKSIYPNMMDAHPPFQIDGNFGICAAICEALLQSHGEEVVLIPAIPKAWASGRVKGFTARTGEKVSFAWKDGIAWRE